MDSKVIKAKLKSIRENIDRKEFGDAKVLCMEILGCNENEYMALLFAGLAEAELGNIEDSKRCYVKAVRLDSSKLQAWMGLHKLYNENECLERDELFLEILNVLIAQNPSREKLQLYMKQKLEISAVLKNESEFSDTLKKVVESLDLSLAPLALKGASQFPSLHTPTKTLINSYLDLVAASDISEDIVESLGRPLYNYFDKHCTWSTIREFFQKSQSWSLKLESVNQFFILGFIVEIVMVDKDTDLPISKINEVLKGCALKPEYLTEIVDLILEEDWLEAFEVLEEFILEPIVMSPSVESQMDTFIQIVVLYFNRHYATFLSKLKDLENYIKRHEGIFVGKCIAQNSTASDTLLRLKYAAYIAISDVTHAKSLYDSHFSNSKDKEACTLNARLMIAMQDYENAHRIIAEENLVVEKFMLHIEKNDVLPSHIEEFGTRMQNVDDMDTCENHFLLGKLMWMVGDRGGTVVKEFLSAAKLDSRDWRPFLYLGYYYAHHAKSGLTCDLKEITRAIRCFEQAFTIALSWGVKNEKVMDEIMKATSDAYSIDASMAEKHAEFLKHAIHVQPRGWSSLRLGELQTQCNDVDAAVSTLQKLVSQQPHSHEAWMALASAYSHRGSYESSIKCLATVMHLTRDVEEYKNAKLYAEYKLASVNCVLGKFEDSINASTCILGSMPHYIPAVLLYAEANYKYAQQLVKESRLIRAADRILDALGEVQRCLVAAPCNSIASLWKLLADCLLMLTTLPVTCQTRLLLDQQLFTLIGMENFCVERDLYDCISRCYMKCVQCQPSISGFWFDLALALFLLASKSNSKKYFCQAETAVKRCVQLNKTATDALSLLAIVYATQGYLHKAQHCLVAALNQDARNAKSWTILGILYFEQGNVQLSHKCISMAQSIDPSMAQPWCIMGLIAEKMGDHLDSVDLFRHTSTIACLPLAIEKYAEMVMVSLKQSGIYSAADPNVMQSVYFVQERLSIVNDLSANDKCSSILKSLADELSGLNKTALERLSAFGAGMSADEMTQQEQNSLNVNKCRLSGKLGQYDTFRKFSKTLAEECCTWCMKGVALAKLAEMDKAAEMFERSIYLTANKPESEAVKLSLQLCRAVMGNSQGMHEPCESGLGLLINLVWKSNCGPISVDDVRCCFSQMVRHAEIQSIEFALQFIELIWSKFTENERRCLCNYLIHLLPYHSVTQRIFVLQSFPNDYKVEDYVDFISTKDFGPGLKRSLQMVMHYWPYKLSLELHGKIIGYLKRS